MAEDLTLQVNTNIKSATKDTEDWSKSLKDVNTQIDIQNEEITRQERTLIKLKAQQDKMAKGGWSAGMPKLNADIAKTSRLLNLEKNTLKDLKNQQKTATKEVKEFSKAQKDADKTLRDGIGSIKLFGVSLNSIGKKAKSIIPTIKLLFSTVKTGIMATGIGALVIAFGVLMTWFTKTKVGAESLQKIFAGVGAAVRVITDRITDFASGVGVLFSGEIMQGLTDMKNSFLGIGQEIIIDTALTVSLQKQMKTLADSERALSVETAKRKSEIEDLRLKAQDLNRTEEERIGFLEQASAIEQKQIKKRVENAQTAVDIQKTQNSLKTEEKVDLDELAQKEIALADIQRQSAKKQRMLIRRTNMLRKSAAADEEQRQRDAARLRQQIEQDNEKLLMKSMQIQQEIGLSILKDEELRDQQRLLDNLNNDALIIENSKLSREEKDAALLLQDELYEIRSGEIEDKYRIEREEEAATRKENLDILKEENRIAELDTQLSQDLARIDEEQRIALLGIANLKNNKAEEQEIIKKFDKERVKSRKAAAEKEEAINRAVATAQVDLANNAFGALAALAGENEAMSKGVAVAQTIFSTQQAIMAALAATSVGDKLLPFPVRLANAGIAGVMGINAVRNIMSTQPGSTSVPTPADTSAPAASAEPPSPTMMSGAFSLSGGEEDQPIRSYVVSDDITDSQNGLAIIRRRATI